MHIDDDTELPDDFVLDETVWDDPRSFAATRAWDFGRERFKVPEELVRGIGLSGVRLQRSPVVHPGRQV